MRPREWLAAIAKRTVGRLGYELVPAGSPVQDRFGALIRARDEYRRAAGRVGDAKVSPFEAKFLEFCASHALESTGQMFQDLFVLFVLREKAKGFFVEFGATDGVYLSNTLLLETQYGWNGILAEPGKVWHPRLSRNRKCAIDDRCVWSTSGETLRFNEVARYPGLSTIDRYSGRDIHRDARQEGKSYLVQTVSLNELLLRHNAPNAIDYLSIDTEGSELEILSTVDFRSRSFSVITVEHNGAAIRDGLHELLVKQGYARVCERFSRADDWYVRDDLRQD